MGIRSELKRRAIGLSSRALERLFADEKRAQQVAEAIGAVQRGKQAVDQTQAVVMHQLNFATRGDFKALGRQLGTLTKRAQALDAKLSALG